jgi:hypothetical protein
MVQLDQRLAGDRLRWYAGILAVIPTHSVYS